MTMVRESTTSAHPGARPTDTASGRRPEGLLTLDEALNLDLATSNRNFDHHLNKYLLQVFKVLGMDQMDVVSAQGTEITLRDGSRKLDFSCGIGICGAGHNHPRIVAAEQRCHVDKVIDLMRVAPHKLQGALAYNLARCLPEPLKVAFFSVSGAEAVEAALKLCERVQLPKGKTKFLAMQGAFHGKTHGTLPTTTAHRFQQGFLMGIPKENMVYVPYGDLDAVEAAIRAETVGAKNSIIAAITEPIRGEGCEVPPAGFLSRLAQVCRAHDILVIFDEVKTGMGRTGRFCAFQHEDVVPDAVTFAKALGGGKRAIGAMVTSQQLFDKAYGSVQDCTLHTSGFSGLGESCAVAIEMLNVLYDENLIGRAAESGAYLRRRLEELQAKHPKQILEVRGRGLFQALRLNFSQALAEKFVDIKSNPLFRTYQTVLIGALVRDLYERHDIIVHFQPGAVDVVHFMPPLNVSREHLDRLVDGLDQILSRGFTDATLKFIGQNIKRVFSFR